VVNDLGGAVDGTGSSSAAAQLVVDEIKAAGGEAVADFNSVSERDSARAIIKTAVDNYGRVDILVNNAGILRDKSFKKMTDDEYQLVIDVHLMGTVWVCKAAWDIMNEQEYGRIINTTSAASFGNFGQTNYSGAKAGITGFSKSLAQEGARKNIKVNILAPMARTRMTEELLGPLAEKLHPELVTPVIAYCASEECSVTGEVFSAGGGRIARIFWGVTPGFRKDDISGEDIRDNLEAIMDTSDMIVASSPADEMAFLMSK
ncbi:MAG: SDR family NAD(P)-dependent oxidoreductase, partial [Pseudomonadales bacterium]|nr:SDR family NAD(P)-dependent oxidoreductase [Pseudomonadales bacterium]